MTTSTFFKNNTLQYDVALFEPNVPGFAPHAKKNEPLQTVEVEIATIHAPGPRPIVHSPPTYEEETKGPKEARGTSFNQFTSGDLSF